jgi:DNA-binding transcriptional MerR regulator
MEIDEQYTIDDLAARTGMPTRRIRYYQTEGVLPPPVRTGRNATYGPDHLRRLELIAELHRHGLRLGAIADIVNRGETRLDAGLRDLLRNQSRITAGWEVPGPRTYSPAEIEAMIGHLPARHQRDLFAHEFLKRQPDGTARAEQPAILDISIRLLEVDVDVETAAIAGALMQPSLAELADELVRVFLGRVGKGFTAHGSPDEIDRALDVLRPAAAEAAAVFLVRFIGEAIDRQLGEDAGFASVEGLGGDVGR